MDTREKSEPTDEEIKEMMDFDGLIKAYQKAKSKTNLSSEWLKWGIGTSMIATIVLSLYFSSKLVETKPFHSDSILNKQIFEASTIQKTKPTAPTASQLETTIRAATTKKENKIASPKVETVVTTQQYLAAEPVDGYPSLYAYFDRELKYPFQSVKDSIQGIESVAFTIGIDGTPIKIEIQQSLGPNFDQEVKRLIESMPLWKPATMNEKPVVSKISVPFTFRVKKANQ